MFRYGIQLVGLLLFSGIVLNSFADEADPAREAELLSAARVLAPDFPELARQSMRDPNAAMPAVVELFGRVEEFPPHQRMQLHKLMGYLSWRKGELEASMENYEAALSLAREHGDSVQEGLILNGIGGVFWLLQEYDAAEQVLREIVRLMEESGNVDARIRALNNLGLLYRETDKPDAARGALQRAFSLGRAEDKELSLAHTINNLGLLELSGGNFAKARDFFLRALAINRRYERQDKAALQHLELGRAYLGLGESGNALHHAQTAMDLADRYPVHEVTLRAPSVLAQALAAEGRTREAYEVQSRHLKELRSFYEKAAKTPFRESRERFLRDLATSDTAGRGVSIPLQSVLTAGGALLLGLGAGWGLRRWREKLLFKNRQRNLRKTGHDLRTELNALTGMASLLRETKLTDRQSEYLEVIERSGHALATTVQRFQDEAGGGRAARSKGRTATRSPVSLVLFLPESAEREALENALSGTQLPLFVARSLDRVPFHRIHKMILITEGRCLAAAADRLARIMEARPHGTVLLLLREMEEAPPLPARTLPWAAVETLFRPVSRSRFETRIRELARSLQEEKGGAPKPAEKG